MLLQSVTYKYHVPDSRAQVTPSVPQLGPPVTPGVPQVLGPGSAHMGQTRSNYLGPGGDHPCGPCFARTRLAQLWNTR